MDELIIEAGRGEGQYWKDLWRYRELFYFLAWRDFLVRYKQTVIGIAWAVIRPMLGMVAFTIVFGKIAGLHSEGAAPYSMLVYVAVLAWQFFAASVTESSNSLIANPNLVSKIYFPRLIVPASSVITSFADFVISFGLLVVMMGWYQFWPDWRLLTLPLFVLLAATAALGSGLWLCALSVQYRDFRYIVPFLVQFGMYVSPVGFSSAMVPEAWRLVYSVNPMVGVIDGFRWALLRGQAPLHWPGLVASVVVSTALWVFGLWYFRKAESGFADVI
jgi:homopolymeric O-antigen transport system permease protein